MRPIRVSRLTLFNGTARSTTRSTAKSAVTARIAAIAVAAVAATAALTACSGPAPSRPAAANIAAKAPPVYYLALGDSLAQGVQPNAAGISVETPDGYPDQVYAAL